MPAGRRRRPAPRSSPVVDQPDPQAMPQPTPQPTPQPMLLRLYVTGSTRQSARAITNLKRICDEHVTAPYDLEIVDLYQQPGAAAGEQILAAPTLIKKLPPPVRRLIGDLSDEHRVLAGLDLTRPDSQGTPADAAAPATDAHGAVATAHGEVSDEPPPERAG